MTANQINYQKHLEDVRTHVAQENEAIRSHMMSEAQRQQEIDIGYRQAAAAMTNASANVLNAQNNAAQIQLNQQQLQLSQQQLSEQTRHNLATESEATRHNMQAEANQTADTRAGILKGLLSLGGNLVK